MVGIVAAVALFVLFDVGGKVFHYHDAEVYVRAARNLADGLGSLADPVVGVREPIPFREHPPLWIFAHSLWYRVFGQGTAATNAFPAVTLLACSVLIGFAAMRATGDRRAFFWGVLTYAANPTSSKWQHEALLDWGLAFACALTLFVMAYGKRRDATVVGALLGLAFGLGVLSKGIFAFVLLASSLYYLWHHGDRLRGFAGFDAALLGVFLFWFFVDGPDWQTTNAIMEYNVTPRVGPPTVAHALDTIEKFFARNAPWSLLIVLGAVAGWRLGPLVRSAYLIVLLTAVGFIVGRKLSAYYWLIVGPAVAFLAAVLMTRVPPRVEAISRAVLAGLLVLFLGLRPFVPLERPSNRAPNHREFLDRVSAAIGEPTTIGTFDCQEEGGWYILGFGWNHHGLDFRLVCLDGPDEADKYELKIRQYLLPCSKDELDYLMTPETSWIGREELGSIVFTHDGLSLVRRKRPGDAAR